MSEKRQHLNFSPTSDGGGKDIPSILKMPAVALLSELRERSPGSHSKRKVRGWIRIPRIIDSSPAAQRLSTRPSCAHYSCLSGFTEAQKNSGKTERPNLYLATCYCFIPTVPTKSDHARYVGRFPCPVPLYHAEGPLRLFLACVCGKGQHPRITPPHHLQH